MSGFKTHLMGGMAAGAAVSTGYILLKPGLLNPTQLTAVFVIGTIGGLLPDLDSDTGKPLAIVFGLLSVIIPVAFLDDVSKHFTATPEFLVSYFVLSYFFINHAVCEVIKRITVHRGIMHSIPFALLCGEAAFLMFIPSGTNMAIAAGIAVFSGCITHLVLDELNSIVWKFRFIPVIKSSIGSALKLKSGSLSATVFVYMLAGIAGMQVFKFIKMGS
ncbi:conserved membrane hypothetical protein [Desulfamplus magnetovallimortis]|uniref:Membrane-bound metal-dependent hydrolase n=1 Tax=Desulfamplus magnetovallimortis TaxID=1246637 RepID=A0A1W1HI57_9BACT|nr:metal-dependent hydrolase [Desulfamplus magnetovallimortis]SLM32136.1 conserved membrane hypothetical protein [Desulfamplus magnetovallimortis]